MGVFYPPLLRKYMSWGYSWEQGLFTVDQEVSQQQIADEAWKYRKRFGEGLERRGFQVVSMGQPKLDADPIPPPEQGRKQYFIMAWVKKRPFEHALTVPDSAVPELLRLGAKLKD